MILFELKKKKKKKSIERITKNDVKKKIQTKQWGEQHTFFMV